VNDVKEIVTSHCILEINYCFSTHNASKWLREQYQEVVEDHRHFLNYYTIPDYDQKLQCQLDVDDLSLSRTAKDRHIEMSRMNSDIASR
jgi:hypothetical protein